MRAFVFSCLSLISYFILPGHIYLFETNLRNKEGRKEGRNASINVKSSYGCSDRYAPIALKRMVQWGFWRPRNIDLDTKRYFQEHALCQALMF